MLVKEISGVLMDMQLVVYLFWSIMTYGTSGKSEEETTRHKPVLGCTMLYA
jgi:hypothetical protein